MRHFESFSLNDWLLCLETRHHQAVQLGLTRIKQVAERLNLLKWDATVITVAGTNGKGSTIAALEAIYSAAGYQVGSYTSPHLFKFNERIRHNKHPISDEILCNLFSEIENARVTTHLTFFETSTLAALLFFKQLNPDVILLEVGMGGRLDATNIIDADLAIITTIDLDHQAYLGNTHEAIGYEKAGIIRPKKPVIYADDYLPNSIINHASKLNAPMFKYGHDYNYELNQGKFLFSSNSCFIDIPRPRIHPKMAAAAIMATSCLQNKLPMSSDKPLASLASITLAGRLQVIDEPIKQIFDVAHNPQAVLMLAKSVHKLKHKTCKVHAVFSALKDKALKELITIMHPYVDNWYPCVLSCERATDQPQLLQAFTEAVGYKPFCYANASQAYQAAMQKAKAGDIILVYGSFYLVGNALMDCNNTTQERVQ